jgi:hypothetical protein
MNFGGDSVNVYAEAKSEYTRQLCQILTPAFQIYFLDLLKIAKEKDSDARRMLWNFQALLQEIPDWSQDKVIRETEKIQRESNCDYLEELLTAVFIAHTKVLSAIRITTKNKKLQITIPKIDHFLHRTLRETGRLLWGNAFLFAEQGSPIDRQKNMRQVEALIQDGIQQSIRSLLPVKTILREYLNDEADEGEGADEKDDDEGDEKGEKEEAIEIKTKEDVLSEPLAEVPTLPSQPALVEEVIAPIPAPMSTTVKHTGGVNIIKEDAPAPTQPVNQIMMPEVAPPAPVPVQTLVVETEPSVSFTNMDTIFDSDNPEANEISHASHAEEEDIDHVEMLDLPPEPMDEFEDLESAGGPGGIDFEEIA